MSQLKPGYQFNGQNFETKIDKLVDKLDNTVFTPVPNNYDPNNLPNVVSGQINPNYYNNGNVNGNSSLNGNNGGIFKTNSTALTIFVIVVVIIILLFIIGLIVHLYHNYKYSKPIKVSNYDRFNDYNNDVITHEI